MPLPPGLSRSGLWLLLLGSFLRDRDQVGEDAPPVPTATSCQVVENFRPGLRVTLVFTSKPATCHPAARDSKPHALPAVCPLRAPRLEGLSAADGTTLSPHRGMPSVCNAPSPEPQNHFRCHLAIVSNMHGFPDSPRKRSKRSTFPF